MWHSIEPLLRTKTMGSIDHSQISAQLCAKMNRWSTLFDPDCCNRTLHATLAWNSEHKHMFIQTFFRYARHNSFAARTHINQWLELKSSLNSYKRTTNAAWTCLKVWTGSRQSPNWNVHNPSLDICLMRRRLTLCHRALPAMFHVNTKPSKRIYMGRNKQTRTTNREVGQITSWLVNIAMPFNDREAGFTPTTYCETTELQIKQIIDWCNSPFLLREMTVHNQHLMESTR